MLLQLSMFHKIPEKRKEKSFQFKHYKSKSKSKSKSKFKSKSKDGSSTLAYPHTAHIHCGPTNELTQNQSLGPISKAHGPTIKAEAKTQWGPLSQLVGLCVK